MADKKKVYSIVINGLKESVDLTKSLNEQMAQLESSLKKIKSTKIKIEGEVDIDDSKQKKKIVSGDTGSSSSSSSKEDLVAKEKELAIQKQLTAEIRATGQAQAALTDEYKEALSETIKQQNATKQVKQEMTDMFNGARDSAGNYTNTLAGLRAELRDLTKEQKSVELGGDEYNKLDERILALTSNLKALESAHGDFRRNVGNYPTAEIEAFRAKFEQLYGEMQRLVQESNNLQRQLAQATPGTEEYDRLKTKLSAVQSELARAKDSVDDFNKSLNATPKNFEIKVGDTVRNFDSVKDAIKTLTRELQEMTIEGKTDTQQFSETITVLGRLKTAIKSAGDEVSSYVGNAKGLSDTLEIMKGAAGIAGIGQGLQMLFGGTNKELDETIQKFGGLMLIMQGIETQYKAMQDANSIYGNSLKTVWNWLDKIGDWKFLGLPSLNEAINYFGNAAESAKKYQSALKSIQEWSKNGDLSQLFANVKQQINEAAGSAQQFSNDFRNSINNVVNTINGFQIVISTAPTEQKLASLQKYIDALTGELQRLNAMAVNPNISTENAERLRAEIEELQLDIDKLNSAKVALETGDTEQLFENLNNDMEQFESHMDELEGKGIDTEQFKKLWQELKTVAQNAQVANANIAQTPKLLRNTGIAGQFMAKCMQGASVAIKGVTTAIKGMLKATIILAIVQLAFEALTWAVEKLADAFSALKGPSSLELEDRLDMVGEAAERTAKKIDDYSKAVDRAAKTGAISELDAEVLKLKAVEKAAMEAAKGLKDFLDRQDEIEAAALQDNLNNSHIWGDAADIKNIDEFTEHYHMLEKAVEQGIDKIEAGWTRGSGAFLTAGDAVEQLGDDTKAILADMQNEINKINFNNPEQAVKQFRKITDNELYQSAIANMHTLFPEAEWAQALDRMYNIFSQRVSDMEGRAQDLGTAILAANRQLAKQTELSNINAISDPKKRQAALDDYNKKQRQEEIQGSLADEQHKQDALAALDAEYKQKAIDRQKSYNRASHKTATSGAKKTGDDLDKIMKQIRDNQTAIMKEGLDKEIKLLENQRDDELKAAEKAGKKRGELILSIQEKYNYLIQKKREEWYRKHRKAIEAFNEEILSIQREAADELAEVTGMQKLNQINRDIDENENQRTQRKRQIQYDYTIDIDENLENNNKMLQEQKKFHDNMLKEEKSYIDKKYELQLKESDQNMKNLLDNEQRHYEQQIAANQKAQNEKWEEVYEQAKQGIISEEEAQKMQQEVALEYMLAAQDMLDAHEIRMAEIRKNAEQEQKTIQEQGIQERQQAQDEANRETIDSIKDMYDEIAYISEREQRKNTNRTTGLFNLGKEKRRLQEVLDAYKKTIKETEDEYENLKAQLNDGEIDFNQFTEAKKELDDLRKSAEKSAEDVSDQLKDLFQTWGSSINEFAQKIANQFQDLYGMFNEIMNLKYDMEEEELDREQKQLDRESEMVEKAYDKQAEIVQRYKDKINETEDELKTARGERRLALIDGLAKQREAYLQETEALQKQQLEKEKIAKKEEQLKKKQDALEKKRKILQKQQSLVNAVINTALGVTQALGAWPPPASYAFAAAVGALGATQIGLIASQKFAKGGVIDAPSHSEGGYKIPTKRGISEVEGNEFITNKKTTTHNTEMLYYINSIKRKITREDMDKFFDGKGKVRIPTSHITRFAQGGTMPELTDWNLKDQIQPLPQETERTYVVQVVDIANSLDNYEKIQTLAGIK